MKAETAVSISDLLQIQSSLSINISTGFALCFPILSSPAAAYQFIRGLCVR